MFGDRLKLARKKAGYSLRSLAEALNDEVSAQAIGKYERNEMMPSSGVLSRLTKVLEVSLEYLLSEQVEELEAVEFRKLASTSAGDRAKVEAAVIDHLQRYLAVEEILELDSAAWTAPRLGSRFIGREEGGEILARDLRKEWRLGIDPIPSMTALLEDWGIKVLIISLPKDVSGLTCLVRRPRHKARVPVIVVNETNTLERRRLTLAHELGHRLIDETSSVDHENAANIFAGAFVVPRDHLVREIGENRRALGYKEIIQLKRMYRISAAAFLVRLKQVGIVDDSTVSYAFQTYARGWRAAEPEPLEIDGAKYEMPRRFERLCYRALAEGLISPAKAGELLRQPLGEIAKGLKGPAGVDADRRQ